MAGAAILRHLGLPTTRPALAPARGRGSRGQSYVYELLYAGEGEDGAPFLMGLLDVAKLRQPYDPDFEGSGSRNEPAQPENEAASSPKEPRSSPR